jgi:23S rRNA pseudouridine1911/1915/1917 synthase
MFRMRAREKSVGEHDIFAPKPIRFRVDPSAKGYRLSRCVAEQVEGLSVRAAKELVDRGRVFVDNRRITKASTPVEPGQWVEVFPHEAGRRLHLREEDILWEGKSAVAVNKPPGLLVYGTRGVTEDTVLPQLEQLLKGANRWRPRKDSLRLVHRLDKDTSGLLLMAKNEKSASVLEKQFKQKTVEKRYLALATGRPAKKRFRRASAVQVRRPSPGRKQPRQGPRGETEFEVLESFSRSGCTLLEARPLTGRTHQIRIHLSQAGHHVLGDIVYGPPKCSEALFRAIPRQMLHASFLGFHDPDTGKRVELTAPLPADMDQVLTWLRQEEQKR